MLVEVYMSGQGLGISPNYYEGDPWLLIQINRTNIEPKEITSCLRRVQSKSFLQFAIRAS